MLRNMVTQRVSSQLVGTYAHMCTMISKQINTYVENLRNILNMLTQFKK